MKNFHIIQALCRASLSNPSQAVVRQIERLRDALDSDGEKAEAKKLSSLLLSADKAFDMSPSRIQRSKVLFSGEELTNKTPVPVDKETSSPLAEVFFPEHISLERPMFGQNVELAIQSVLDEWENFEKLEKIDAQPARSCLIYGAPGTGKTHLALWIAKRMNMPVVLARLDGLMSSFLGTTSRNIGNLFAFASRHRCIFLLDEFDAIAKLRNDTQEVGEVKRVVNTLLQNLDFRKDIGFTIGITNHELLLDPAIWRRFDVQIEIPSPSPEVLTRLIQKFISPIEYTEEKIKFLSWCIFGGSGADAKSLSYWLKKSIALEGNHPEELTTLIKRYALLNAGRISKEKRDLLRYGDEELVQSLLSDNKFSFKQKEVAAILGVTPSTLSKKLAKHKDIDSEVDYVQ